MMLAGGSFSTPYIHEAMEAGWQGNFPGGGVANAPLASTYFNMRKTTIYGGSNEVQRNIVAQTVLGLRSKRSARCAPGLLPRAPSGRGLYSELRKE